MVVEDEPMVLEIFRLTLQMHGFNVLCANSAEGALRHWKEPLHFRPAAWKSGHLQGQGNGLSWHGDNPVRRLVERAHAERMTMPDLCAHLFKDYQFGLSLVQKNTGQKSFVLGRGAIDAPDKFLSDLVVQSHYPIAPEQRN